ncbi:Arc family DNA-binding protein [Comamonas aquatica]|uniref:Arc family DNA-binding protein n=1 Tax=Comamonas aquatica TaxID=225991 RepID=UPI003CFC1C8F
MAEKNLYPSDQADKVLVRMPDGMRDRLKEVAKANNRTLNAEIVARLEQSFQQSDPISASENSVIKAVEKSNLETRLMDLLTQWHHEDHNLKHYEARIEHLEDDSYEDAKYLRSIAEEEKSASLRKLGALDEAIRATCSAAKQKGIELNLEEMKKRFK